MDNSVEGNNIGLQISSVRVIHFTKQQNSTIRSTWLKAFDEYIQSDHIHLAIILH